MKCDYCKQTIAGKSVEITPTNGGKLYYAHTKYCADQLFSFLNTANNPHIKGSKVAKAADKPLDLMAIVLDLQRRVKALEAKK